MLVQADVLLYPLGAGLDVRPERVLDEACRHAARLLALVLVAELAPRGGEQALVREVDTPAQQVERPGRQLHVARLEDDTRKLELEVRLLSRRGDV